MGDNDKVKAGLVLTVIFVLALAIKVSQVLFPWFLVLTSVSVIVLLVLIVMRAKNDSFDSDIPITPVAIAAGVFFLLTVLTYFIGFGFGGTSIGRAITQAADSLTGAQQQVSDTTWQAMNQIVDSSCPELSGEYCTMLRNFAKTAKTVQEVTDFADKLKTGIAVAQTLENKK